MRFFVALTIAVVVSTFAIVAASADETRLLVTTLSPPGAANTTRFFRPWSDRINEAAHGTIVLELREGQTLADQSNVYDRVMDDVVQIGWANHSVVGGKFPRSEVATLPFITLTGEENSVALWRLYKTGLLDDEYADIVPLLFESQAQFQLHFVKPVQSLDSLAGLRIGASSKVPLEVIGRLGGAPISVMSQDLYQSLQRGLIDGELIAWAANAIYKLADVTSFHVEINLGASTGMVFMSKKRFDSLTPEAQNILLANSGEKASRDFGHHFDVLQEEQRAAMVSAPGHTVAVLSPAQKAAWQQKIEPLLDEWAASRPNGRKILDTYRTLVTQVRAEIAANPYASPAADHKF